MLDQNDSSSPLVSPGPTKWRCFGGDLCLWLVPSASGRVRKVRLSALTVSATLLSVILFGAGVAFVVSDYGRMSFSKHMISRLLGSVAHERNGLKEENSRLKRQLAQMRIDSERTVSFQSEVEDRLSQLARILKSGSPFDPFFEKTAKNTKTSESQGVGGLEVDCQASHGCEEAHAKLDISKIGLSGDRQLSSGIQDQQLLDRLDRFILVLSSLPIGRPVFGRINSGYGLRISPFSGKLTRHEGVDISAPRSSSVLVTGDGRVENVTKNSTYGLMVDIRHSNRILTRYAHLSKSLVKKGDFVSRGDVIALVGSTGRSTGPHTHYEVRVDGRPINPKKLLELDDSFDQALIVLQKSGLVDSNLELAQR